MPPKERKRGREQSEEKEEEEERDLSVGRVHSSDSENASEISIRELPQTYVPRYKRKMCLTCREEYDKDNLLYPYILQRDMTLRDGTVLPAGTPCEHGLCRKCNIRWSTEGTQAGCPSCGNAVLECGRLVVKGGVRREQPPQLLRPEQAFPAPVAMVAPAPPLPMINQLFVFDYQQMGPVMPTLTREGNLPREEYEMLGVILAIQNSTAYGILKDIAEKTFLLYARTPQVGAEVIGAWDVYSEAYEDVSHLIPLRPNPELYPDEYWGESVDMITINGIPNEYHYTGRGPRLLQALQIAKRNFERAGDALERVINHRYQRGDLRLTPPANVNTSISFCVHNLVRVIERNIVQLVESARLVPPPPPRPRQRPQRN